MIVAGKGSFGTFLRTKREKDRPKNERSARDFMHFTDVKLVVHVAWGRKKSFLGYKKQCAWKSEGRMCASGSMY